MELREKEYLLQQRVADEQRAEDKSLLGRTKKLSSARR